MARSAQKVARAKVPRDDRAAADLVAARIMARSLAEARADDERVGFARSFCLRLARAWWAALDTGGLSLRPLIEPIDIEPLPEPAGAAADSMGATITAFEPEQAAYAIGLVYTAMLPASYRSTHGVYYTPPALTARLIAQATAAGVDWKKARVLDPACGGGAFLAPIAKRILAALPDVTPAILVQNLGARLAGFEVDCFAAWLSQVTLDAVLLPVCRAAGRPLPLVVTVCDSLARIDTGARFDLVIGNPPYGRVTLSPEQRERYRRSLHGHANLYGLFTDLALRHCRPGGVIAYVTPTSFLAGEYFKNLRGLLGREAPPAAIDLVAARRGVFEDVLQETLLATWHRGGQPKAAPVCEVTGEAGGETLRIEPAGHFSQPADPSAPWLLPRTPAQADLIERLRVMPNRLADWGYAVSTGPLVWNRFKGQIQGAPAQGRYPLVWAEAITTDGRFLFRAEKRNHKPWFQPGPGDDWLITRQPCVLLQRTTAKEQARRLIAAVLPAEFLERHGAVVVENHLNMLRPTGDRPAVPASVLAAFLNSAAADQAFRCVSGSVAVSAYELHHLPLPSPAALERALTPLLSEGAARERIEAACTMLYATPSDEVA